MSPGFPRRRRLLAAVVTGCLLTGIACGDDNGTAPVKSTFEDVIASGGDVPDPVDHNVVTDSVQSTELRGNENWSCVTRTYDVTRAPEEFPLFDPNSEVIFPGNLLQGKSLPQATPEPIPVRRGGGTIVVTLNNGATTGVSRTVPVVSLGSVYDAANDIIGTNPGNLPARFNFSTERVESERQLAIATNMSWEAYSLWKMKGGLSVDVKTRRNHNKFLVKLNQAFYTVAYELPTSPDQMFASDVTPDELKPYIGPGNPATFISSVTFGRIFYLLIESTQSADSIAASINLSFSGALGKFTDTTTAKFVDRLDSLHVTAYALGGDANQALRAVTTSFDSLKSFLAEGGNIKTGLPISYVVRSVRRPEKIVKVGLNTVYDVRDCRPIMETFGQPLLWLAADDTALAQAAAPGGRFTVWHDLSESGNDAYVDHPVTVDSQKPLRVLQAVNGQMPAARFGYGAWMRFVGGGFSGTDYTISMVASFQLNPTYGFDFLGGTTYLPNRMLVAGFAERNNPLTDPYTFGLNHYGLGVVTDRIPYPEQFHLYTLEFSQLRGMSLYIDGEQAAWNPAVTAPLQDFLGARLGNVQAVPDASISIAEFLAFPTTLTADQRRYLEDNLMRKYKF
ncbi:MAG TPA: thiol-activated cytolysin family protein [Gemmatimonadales bacterium]|nr:thiol-activated cytolysin family protein [Gemmatimonadales bacterium]